MTQENIHAREPLTGGKDRFPMLDRNDRQLHVGDRIRAQVVTGPYGQTAIVETTVTRAHEPYGQIQVANTQGIIAFHYRNGVLMGRSVHKDYDHGHETWVEIIS